MAWLPEYGVGMFAMATLTYSGPSEPISPAWDAMLEDRRPAEARAAADSAANRDARAHPRAVEALGRCGGEADRGR